MLLRVIKERYHEDGTPELDQSRPNQPQLVNGGMVRVLDTKTGQFVIKMPGEVFELPDNLAQDLLANAPRVVEPEERHQARLARVRQRDEAREHERRALDARMAELSRETAQAQKLRSLAEQRERELAAENLRVQQQAAGADAQLAEMRRLMEDMQRQQQAQIAELQAKLAAAAAASPAVPPEPVSGYAADAAAPAGADAAAGLAGALPPPSDRNGRKKPNG